MPAPKSIPTLLEATSAAQPRPRIPILIEPGESTSDPSSYTGPRPSPPPTTPPQLGPHHHREPGRIPVEMAPNRSPASSCSDASTASTELFQPVIDAIDFQALEAAALQARRTHPADPTSADRDKTAGLSCSIQGLLMKGSYSLVYRLAFSDGVTWVARIPGHRTTGGPLEAQRMLADIQETATTTVRVPYRLEAWVPGLSLAEGWADPSWATKAKRTTVLWNLARAMAELAPF
ncbi:MAG: hypothetical protein M1826_003828 [Phylliscum demangeonii]|nr:MAG: hypothetical protein M1826_003828 [Phylliscum demangeonii]